MGIKERQERDRETIRRGILDAARELFVTEGFENVSIRKIAEKIEYSPAAIYSYFQNKDDIFFALAEEGFRLLAEPAESWQREFDSMPPLDRVRAMLWRFFEFSREQPAYFALMFVDRTVPRITREYERFAFVHQMKARITHEIQRCIDQKLLPPTLNPQLAFRVLTAGIYGIAVMRGCDRLTPGEDADALARDVLNTTIAGLQTGVELTGPTSSC